MKRLVSAAVLASAVLALHAAPAAAQEVSAAAQQAVSSAATAQASGRGPLVLEPIRSGFVLAPEVKVTRVDGTDRALLGGYVGWLMDNSLLVGGGGYFAADWRSNHADMYYGGGVVAWGVQASERIHVGVRGLAGYGQARLPVPGTVVIDGHDFGFDFGHGPHDMDGGGFIRQPRFRQNFFIAEPQADVNIRLWRRIWLNAGAGYRAIADANGSESRLRGAFGSAGVRIGPY